MGKTDATDRLLRKEEKRRRKIEEVWATGPSKVIRRRALVRFLIHLRPPAVLLSAFPRRTGDEP
jgi:hypothetical protein